MTDLLRHIFPDLPPDPQAPTADGPKLWLPGEHVAPRDLPSPADPMKVARIIVDEIGTVDGVPLLAWWRGDFYRWNGANWEPVEDSTIDRWLYRTTEHAIYTVLERGEPKQKPWAPVAAKVTNLRDALGRGALQRDWQMAPHDGTGFIALRNGALDLATRVLLPASPVRFNLSALPFGYDPHANCPEWLRFLGQILDADAEAHDLLQEWFGYVLVGDTSQQKILNVVGPKRGGKGTILRVLTALVGQDAVAQPTLDSLAGTFGEQPLIGKRLAAMTDVRWTGSRIGEAVGVLLAISGEDSRTIHRKHKEAWNGRLDVRFLMLSNELPKFSDSSTALAGRFLNLILKVSFYGREDPGLTNRLLAELPGIFNWALAGFDRLTTRGHFVEPKSSAEATAEMERLSSPVKGFVQDCCELTGSCWLPDLHERYVAWCVSQGMEKYRVPTAAQLSRQLRAAYGELKFSRARHPNGSQFQCIEGLHYVETFGETVAAF